MKQLYINGLNGPNVLLNVKEHGPELVRRDLIARVVYDSGEIVESNVNQLVLLAGKRKLILFHQN